ncbi:MAG: hypothetical protein SFX73_06225 [Kofleriaceae bacterium]|nr:hypothetical protein [Kofleriaceae bacterium]
MDLAVVGVDLAAAVGVAVAMGAAVVNVDDGASLHALAIAIGQAWAHEVQHALRAAHREIIGPWPGTLREARTRVYIGVRKRLAHGLIDELAQVANVAARRGWQAVRVTDPEP